MTITLSFSPHISQARIVAWLMRSLLNCPSEPLVYVKKDDGKEIHVH